MPLPVISPSAVLADVTQSRRSNIPFDDQEPLANHAEIGFNHCWQPSQIIPHSQMKAPRRLGAIVFFQSIDGYFVRTWVLDVVIRRLNSIEPFHGLYCGFAPGSALSSTKQHSSNVLDSEQ